MLAGDLNSAPQPASSLQQDGRARSLLQCLVEAQAESHRDSLTKPSPPSHPPSPPLLLRPLPPFLSHHLVASCVELLLS